MVQSTTNIGRLLYIAIQVTCTCSITCLMNISYMMSHERSFSYFQLHSHVSNCLLLFAIVHKKCITKHVQAPWITIYKVVGLCRDTQCQICVLMMLFQLKHILDGDLIVRKQTTLHTLFLVWLR